MMTPKHLNSAGPGVVDRLHAGRGVQADVEAYVAWSTMLVLGGYRTLRMYKDTLKINRASNPHLIWPGDEA